jgi:hypothetical protein
MRSAVFAVILGLAGIAATPVSLRADDRDHRYYDRDAKDYHEWNGAENRAWHEYLEQQHREYRNFQRVKPDEQREYWRWRHQHEEHRDRDRDRDRR